MKDVVWTRHLAADIRRPQTNAKEPDTMIYSRSPYPIYKPLITPGHRAKHFRVSQAFIRGKGEDGSIHVNKIGTNDHHSELFAKALCAELFRKHRDVVMGPEHLQKCVPAPA